MSADNLAATVPASTHDHLPAATAYQRLNKRVAIAVTNRVGTMTCAWVFCLIALLSLPATLAGFSVFQGVFPSFLVNVHLILLVAWVAQTFIQLVLLSIIMVGQSVQSAAADARSAKTFADVEALLDAMDIHTPGGLRDLLDRLEH